LLNQFAFNDLPPRRTLTQKVVTCEALWGIGKTDSIPIGAYLFMPNKVECLMCLLGLRFYKFDVIRERQLIFMSNYGERSENVDRLPLWEINVKVLDEMFVGENNANSVGRDDVTCYCRG
jgi:hypothetical protein